MSLYSNAGATDKAIEFYEKAIEENPHNKHAYANLGSTLLYRDTKRAKEYLQKAFNIDPEHDIALIELGKIDKSEGKHCCCTRKIQESI